MNRVSAERVFPESPSRRASYTPKFTDELERRPGAPGPSWVYLLGQPRIFANRRRTSSMGPNFSYMNRYFARYYLPLESDAVDLSFSLLNKGEGKTLVAVCANSIGSSYLYVMFDSAQNEVGMGVAHGIDITVEKNFEPQVDPVTLKVPVRKVAQYRLRFDPETRELVFSSADLAKEYLSWADEGELVPHGLGYRYFGLASDCAEDDSGLQVSYVSGVTDL